ncbi:unnamed protein product [Discula destructiva]
MAALLKQALVVGFLAGAGTSSPLSPHIGSLADEAAANLGPGKISLKQVRNPNYRFIGALSVKKTHLKYGKAVPDWLEEAVAKSTAAFDLFPRDQGSASATPIDNVDDAYVTPISIGTPGQTLNLDCDTASSDLWVYSTDTPASETSGQTLYDPSKSSTSSPLSGATWSVSYGDGSSSSGNVVTDVVSLGGLNVTGQAVEVALQVSSTFTSETEVDGLLGLAFSSINTVTPTKQSTFFEMAKPSLSQQVFTADLKYHAPGQYNFGYIDNASYTGEIAYTDIDTSDGFWTFTSTGYAVGSGSLSSTSITGIADTGTTLLYLPDEVVSDYYGQVSGSSSDATAGGYVLPCGTTPPPFSFGVGSATITIPGEYINFGPVTTDGSSCFGGIQSSATVGVNIFGDVALKAAFVVFDGASTPRIGWASKAT